jgi:hypothetical protein
LADPGLDEVDTVYEDEDEDEDQELMLNRAETTWSVMRVGSFGVLKKYLFDVWRFELSLSIRVEEIIPNCSLPKINSHYCALCIPWYSNAVYEQETHTKSLSIAHPGMYCTVLSPE